MAALSGLKTVAFSTVLLVCSAGSAVADSVRSQVITYTPGSLHKLILADRTVMEYDPLTTRVPVPIAVGDVVEIDYSSNEEMGIYAIRKVEVIKPGQ